MEKYYLGGFIMLTRLLLEKCDELFAKSLVEPDERKSMLKAGASGFIEGVIDGAVIMFPVLLAACIVYNNKLNDK